MKQHGSNTIQLPVRDFAKKQICDGHLFLATKEGRKFYLMKPGVFVDPDFVKKHATHNTVFDFNAVTNEDIRKQFIFILKELRYLQYEKDMRLKAFEIVRLFERFFSEDAHFLNFAMACYEVFCDLPTQVMVKLHETDLYLFRKALYSASFSVIIGLTNDFYHPLLLKDFFNLTLVLDLGLCDADYSYYVSEACNHENQRPGSGKEWLIQQKATESEMKVFLGHPEKSYQFLKDNRGVLAHPELAEIVLYQHELSDGSGFPRGVPKGLVSSWESVVILADSLVTISPDYDFENRVVDYLYNFKGEKLGDLPVGRVYRKLFEGLHLMKSLKETGS